MNTVKLEKLIDVNTGKPMEIDREKLLKIPFMDQVFSQWLGKRMAEILKHN